MKPNSILLYKLIHSLSSSEKRYFKLYAQRHQIKEVNNYFLLYETIVSKNIQQDNELKGLLKNVSFKTYLPVAKRQLFYSVLKSLDLFHQSSSKKELIKSLAHQSQILLDKGLFSEAEKTAIKAKKMAIKYEFFELLNESFSLQEKIYSSQNYKQISFSELELFHKEKLFFLNTQRNYLEYWNLFSLIYKYHFQKVKSIKSSEENVLEKWFKNNLLQDEKNALSTKTKIIFFQLKALEAFLKNNVQDALKNNQKILNIFDSNTAVKEVNAKKYLSIFNNYLIDCLQSGNEVELDEGLKKLRLLPKEKAYKKLPETAVHVFRFSYQLEFNKNLSKGNFSENLSLIQTVQGQIEVYKNKLNPITKTTFYYLFLYSCFGADKIEDSIDWANNIIYNTKEKVLEELQISARLILLLAHYELGNEELLESTISNTRRYHLRKKKLYKLEATLLSAIALLIKTNKKERSKVYTKLKNDLEIIKAENKEGNIFNNFNYLAWVSSKLEHISFEKAYKKLIVY